MQLKRIHREQWGLAWLENRVQDVRHGLRRLRRSPGFAGVAVMTLALGIGGTTAIFSVVNGILLKPLPYLHPERLVGVGLTGINPNGQNVQPLSTADYLLFREQSRTFQDIGVYDWGINSSGGEWVNVTGHGEPQRVLVLPATDGLLPILGVTPLLGRLFTRADDRPGSPNTVILTYGYWRNGFGGERSVIGKTIDVDGKPRTIIGVLPEHFRFLDTGNLAMLMPMKLDRAKTYLGDYEYGAIARLKRGVTLAQANADVARMLPIVLRSFPVYPGYSLKQIEDLHLRPHVLPLRQQVTGDIGKVLWILMGGISLVLVIACANIANLLLVRARGRKQELTIRAALGASRGRIAAELFSESLILAVFGGLLGLGLAYGALRVLVALAPTGLPRLNEIGVNGSVVVFALALSLAASLLSGSVPVFQYASARLGNRLRDSGRSMSESRERRRARGVLLIVQVALAIILLVGSGLMIRTFRALTGVNPGFAAPSEVQTFRVATSSFDTQAEDPEHVLRIDEKILQNLAALPGVSSVGVSAYLPMGGNSDNEMVFTEGRAYAPGEAPMFRFGYVAPGFFRTLGTPLIAGHDFAWRDLYSKRPMAIVSESFAREYWHEPAAALGKQVRTSTKEPWREIVGVVADVHLDGVHKAAPASVYLPIFMANFEGEHAFVYGDVAFVLRSRRAGSSSLMNEVRRAVWSVEPDLPLGDVHTLDYYYTKSMARTSFTLVMLVIAGGMALLIGIVGLYGVIAYSVSQRTHEIGIRMALGAQKRDVLGLVLIGGMSLVVIGVGIGIAAALALTRFLSGLLYGIEPTDPMTFIAVSLVLIGVALLACYVPARRATKVDPMEALRYE